MLPHVILHNAVSVDGRMDWLAVDLGIYYQVISRWHEDATLVGSQTILAAPDEIPEETEADLEPPQIDPDDRRPLLVVPDSRGRIKTWHYLRKQPYWRDILVLCSQSTPEPYLDYLNRRQIKFFISRGEHVDLRAALEELNTRYGVKAVRVDSGGTLNGVLLRAGLVNEISVLIHPCLVGGESCRSIFHAPDLSSADGVIPCRLTHFEKLSGDVVWLIYEVLS